MHFRLTRMKIFKIIQININTYNLLWNNLTVNEYASVLNINASYQDYSSERPRTMRHT